MNRTLACHKNTEKRWSAGWVFLIALLLALTGCARVETEIPMAVTIGTGSGTMKYAEALVQTYNRSRPPGEQISLAPLPSGAGSTGDSQMAVDAVLGVAPEADTDWTVSLGWSAVAAVVHAGNPVKNLASSGVRDILLGIDRNWQDLGGADQPISVFAPDPATDIGEAFQAVAIPENRYSGGVSLLPDSWAVADSVAAEFNGLGFLLCPDITSTVTVLSIDGVKPAKKNLLDGSYPYRIPIFLSAHQPVPGGILDFAAWAQTEAGQSLVSDLCQAG